jgi:hypothetical protein
MARLSLDFFDGLFYAPICRFQFLNQLNAQQNGRDLVTQLMRESRKESVALRVELACFALRSRPVSVPMISKVMSISTWRKICSSCSSGTTE